uniref:Uncharacterized protein n=1 Tax=Arion vulgaris TaxID=1028688 RepID=A0A0B7AXJ3_9EUPU
MKIFAYLISGFVIGFGTADMHRTCFELLKQNAGATTALVLTKFMIDDMVSD